MVGKAQVRRDRARGKNRGLTHRTGVVDEMRVYGQSWKRCSIPKAPEEVKANQVRRNTTRILGHDMT